jgi:hypothetical protein
MVIMAHDGKGDGQAARPVRSADEDFRSARRQALKIGALIVPAIATLHATPAWAQTDYTMVAYRYGTNAGLCRNPKFDPTADPTSPEGQEFIRCPGEGARPSIDWTPQDQSDPGGLSGLED